VLTHASAKEHIRAELARLQKQNGLSLVSFFGGAGNLYVVTFENRSGSETNLGLNDKNVGGGAISPDGTEIAFQYRRPTGRISTEKKFPEYRAYLGLIRQDGSDLREYPQLEDPYGMCWSYENSSLVMSVNILKDGQDAPSIGLRILDLRSGATEEIDVKGRVTTQCWSPDSKQIVYEADQTVRLYDKQQKKSRSIAKGGNATWSPDGNWIAFLDDGRYYFIRPSGDERRLLFRMKDALTPLWWSPDCRFVAYMRRDRLFEGSWIPEEQGRLRVRRLDDNAEDWVANLFVGGYIPSFQWVQRRSLPR
jgi:Tol biopolymer transport system component